MSIELFSTGAAEEVTGSHHYIDIDGNLIEIDCGMFQGKREECNQKNKELPVDPKDVKSIIITHAHFDHCGALPYVVKKGYRGHIYATSATRDLANLVMLDSAKIQANDYKILKKKADKEKKELNWKPLYNEDDCVKTSNQILTVPYYRDFNIIDGVSARFYDAGHILGSSLVEVSIKKKKSFLKKLFGNSQEDYTKILYTGDLGRPVRPIIRKPDVNVEAPDYIFLESTYGNRLHQNSKIAYKELAKAINDTIKKGGKVIIPSFAIERTQEMIYYIHKLLNEKKIPKVPIYIDSPMATAATSIFQVHPECYDNKVRDMFLDKHKNPFNFDNLNFVSSVKESKKLDTMEEPMIIIAADGMCEAGRILQHLSKTISDEKNTVLIVGFMAENTLGRKLVEGEKSVKIMDSMYEVKANIEKINAFSAHADYNESIEWLKQIDTSKLKGIFLVHGEPDAQKFLKNKLEEKGYKNVEIVKVNKHYKI